MKVELDIRVCDVMKDAKGVVLGWYGHIFDHQGKQVKVFIPRGDEAITKDRARVERERVFRPRTEQTASNVRC